MIDRRTFVTLVAGACLLKPLAVCAQQTGKVYRIGLLVVINLKTAKAFGITIPQSLLQRADEVIQ